MSGASKALQPGERALQDDLAGYVGIGRGLERDDQLLEVPGVRRGKRLGKLTA